jgi:nitrogen fixation NifU-like protein
MTGAGWHKAAGFMSESASHYSKTVLDHFLNPRNAGPLADADGVGEVGAAAFGDVVRISLKVRADRVTDARFQAYGCGTAIATASVATELIKGRTLAEALKLTKQEIHDALGGLPPEKAHCPLLAEEAVKAALQDFLKQNPAAAPAVGTATAG